MEPVKACALSVVCFAVVTTPSLGLPESAPDRQKTQKLSQSLVDRAANTLEKIKETEDQLRAVMEKYEKLLSKRSVEERRNEHKKVVQELGKLEARAKGVRECTREMEEEADKFFAEWSGGLDGIGDAELSSISRQRLSETQNGYGEIVTAGRVAADEYDVFVKALRNQLRYFELDMSDESVKKLKSVDRSLKGKVSVLQARIRDLSGTIERYVKSLS